MTIAYLVSLFPKLSETFILREMIEVERIGHTIVVVSLKREQETIVHEEALRLARETLYPAASAAMALSILYWMLRRPLAVAAAAARIGLSHRRHPVMMLKSLALVPSALHVARLLRGKGVRHIHAHWASYPATAAWVIARVAGLRYSVTAHAHDLFLPNPMLARKVADSAFFATISEFNRSLLIQTCGPAALEKVRLIRCGLPLERFQYRKGPVRREPGAAPLLVSVGRLVDYKGFDVLLQACSELRRRGRPVRCVIVGEGPERERLERLAASLGLGDAATLAGGRRQDEVLRLIESADLFALACVRGRDGQQDGVPIVLMEAMALGVPVVSTKLSGIPELVIDNRTGLLAAPGDEGHLADAIDRMLTDADLAERLRREARSLVEKEFDIRRWAARLCSEVARSGARP